MIKVAIVKGTSSTGKGVRVSQLLEFLKTKFKHKNVRYVHNNKSRQLGILFPELGWVFIGRVVTSNKSGLASWTSMDDLHATTTKGEIARRIIKEEITDKGYSFVAEGEPLMASDKWRPLFMNEYYGAERFLFQYFHYAGDREAYDQRIIGRSGKAAGESGWHREKNYETEHLKVNDEFTSLGLHNAVCPVSGPAFWEDGDGRVSNNLLRKYDAPHWCWGVEFLSFNGLDDLVDEFVEHAKANPLLREINGANPLAKTKRLW
ncbi:hypothetical protein MYOV003v1_p0109 [Vibrio phage 207E48.1]|nr:hypothetical protein MYOV003v1_p0109 [Vibrio phage 207E48.1]